MVQAIPLIIQGVAVAAAGAQAGLSISQAISGPKELVSSIFGGGNADDKNRENDRKALEKKQAEEEKQRLSRQKITAAAQGRRGVGTLFRRTGELGVKLGETRGVAGQGDNGGGAGSGGVGL